MVIISYKTIIFLKPIRLCRFFYLECLQITTIFTFYLVGNGKGYKLAVSK